MTTTKEIQRQAILTGAHQDYEEGLNKYASFKMSDHAVGEDLVQETFIKTWSYLVKGGRIETMKAFLYHILNNLIVDEYRKRKAVSLNVLMEKGFEPNTGQSGRIFNILDGKAAFLLIQFLPVTYRKVMHMRYIQDLSLQEISLITGQSKNTVAVQAHRGLEKLRLIYSSA
jgi:RNA polymerase sigma-70 factor (ECF subfamily)